MTAPEPFITVVVMTYNEVATVEETVRELHGVLTVLASPFEILVVDDGSTDGSGAIADALGEALQNVRAYHHPQNLGLGGVYRTGFAQARGTFLTFFPADGQFPAVLLKDFWPWLASHDLVLGYLPRRKNSLLGTFLSKMERLVYRVLFGPMPRFQGIMVLRRQLPPRNSAPLHRPELGDRHGIAGAQPDNAIAFAQFPQRCALAERVRPKSTTSAR